MRKSSLSGLFVCVVVFSAGCSDGDSASIDGNPFGPGGNGRAGGNGAPIDIGGDGGGSGGLDGNGCGPNLTGLVRDFRAAGERNGHPDFEAFSGSRASTGIVQDELGADRKPVYRGSGPITTSEGQQTTSKARFDEWYRNTDGVNEAVEFRLTFVEGSNGVATYENREFFPIDGKGFGNYQPYQNGAHNYHFTFELHTEFKYNGGETFRFLGDDDLWVFINGKLAIDLGGLHSELSAEVRLDEIAREHGLVKGQKYPLDLFHAERHTQHSRFRVDSTIEFTNCNPIIIPK